MHLRKRLLTTATFFFHTRSELRLLPHRKCAAGLPMGGVLTRAIVKVEEISTRTVQWLILRNNIVSLVRRNVRSYVFLFFYFLQSNTTVEFSCINRSRKQKTHVRCSYEIVFLIFKKRQRVKLDDFSCFRLLIMFVTYTNGVALLFTGKMSTVFLKGCFSEYSFFP